MSNDIGVIGLSVMGQNLALNIASKGFKCAVWNRTESKTQDTVKRAKDEGNLPLEGHAELQKFVNSLKTPRSIIIMVQAGKPVDLVLESLVPLLSPNDAVIDGGNEWFRLTESRLQNLKAKNIHYMGMGVSGGEEGARHGPALMPGGSKVAFSYVEKILEAISAKSSSGNCVGYIGDGGAGNYVKMIHNGIEYGDMQLISEAFNILKLCGFSNKELSEIFTNYNKGILKSYLIEITARILNTLDNNSNTHIIDLISDKAGSKGTGKWTVQEGAENGIPISIISSALDNRYLSGLTEYRNLCHKIYSVNKSNRKINLSESEKTNIIKFVESALYCSKVCVYSQGIHIIDYMSKKENWNINISEIARIWTGGCIIRAELLGYIQEAYKKNNTLPLLFLHEYFANRIKDKLNDWRDLVVIGVKNSIPIPGMMSALSYFDAFCSEKLSTNLIQAQRDFFGAHEFERLDKPGSFHFNWNEHNSKI